MGIVTVPRWDAVDIRSWCAPVRAIGFDLDGTLARSRQPMNDDMADVLSELTTILPVAIITGGSMALVCSQVLRRLTERARLDDLHVMPTSGTSYYRWLEGRWQCVTVHELSSSDRLAAKRSLRRRAMELGLWHEPVWGDRIEDRVGQVTFSALGQNAPESAKAAWDPSNEKKAALVAAVARDLPGLRVRAGGLTSVDVSQGGIDKAYAVRMLARELDLDVSQIAFVGDRMDERGNDYPAACAGTRAIRVEGPEDTAALCHALVSQWTVPQ